MIFTPVWSWSVPIFKLPWIYLKGTFTKSNKDVKAKCPGFTFYWFHMYTQNKTWILRMIIKDRVRILNRSMWTGLNNNTDLVMLSYCDSMTFAKGWDAYLQIWPLRIQIFLEKTTNKNTDTGFFVFDDVYLHVMWLPLDPPLSGRAMMTPPTIHQVAPNVQYTWSNGITCYSLVW